MNKNRMISLWLVFLLFFSFMPADFISVFAQEDTIFLSTVEDFRVLSKKCSLDTWSQGKQILLMNDLDFTGNEFIPIPTFGGTFDGGGHTISGIVLPAGSPVQGVFRYIQKSGLVQNLNVSVSISSGEGKDTFGGIAGNNRGNIQNCRFSGNISGKSIVGGIVGINESEGRIGNCVSQGILSSQKYTGGIVGENFGILLKCTNQSKINTTSEEAALKLEDIQLEQLDQLDENTVPISGHTDSGGIAGYSSGILQSCYNYGVVGYPHMGYNIGGIAGRQAGYMNGCYNYGQVLGRKDVGGIAGQMEPYVFLQYSEDELQQLNSEMNRLHTLVNQALANVNITSDTVSNRINMISGYASEAKDSSKNLLDQTSDYAGQVSDFVNQSMETVNDISAIVTETLDKTVPVMEDIRMASDTLSDAVGQLSNALEEIDQITQSGKDALQAMKEALNDLDAAVGNLQIGISKIQTAADRLLDAVTGGNPDKVTQALTQLAEGMGGLKTAFQDIGTAFRDLKDALLPIDWGNLEQQKQEIANAVNALESALKAAGNAIADMQEAIDVLKSHPVDWERLLGALSVLDRAMDNFVAAGNAARSSFKKIKTAMDSLQDASDAAGQMVQGVRTSLNTMQAATDSITAAVGKSRDILKDLSEREPITFPALDSDFHLDTDRLYSSLSGVSVQLNNLNTELHSAGKQFTSDLQAISDQFHVVMQLLIDAVSARDTDLSDLTEDISEQDISSATDGKVSRCINYGAVEADLNVGGAVGSMAIEYDLDPEDDISSMGKKSLNFRYEAKAVLLGCVNEGSVTAKKNYAGGLVGRMNLGTIQECEGYGRVESTSGDYVGGIVGLSDAAIRRSYAKCTLAGRSSVGGIAGQAKKMTECYSIVNIEKGTGLVGAVAGTRSKKESGISSNYFLDTGWAGIDNISYAGIAEPISYEALSKQSQLPDKFLQFVLTFRADGNVLGEEVLKFGESLPASRMPQIPEKEGYYSAWPEFDFSNITFSAVLDAVYTPWVTVLTSSETNEKSGKALALAEGNFRDTAILSVTDSTESPPSESGEDSPVMWKLKIEGADITADQEVPVRLLCPAGTKQIKVWCLSGDEWKEVSYTKNGSYLMTYMYGNENTFCITSSKGNIILIVISIATLFILLATFIFLKRKGLFRRKYHSKTKVK
ncbi:hypothetical protein [Acetivibrio sp. MSJd-27]|uniref:hypothetical protein n=1 Tax=Acetivibrio sp. MSJd-27 TaxID=2841523 RepID=UPI001C11E725|nr:hypothetical protein [Acetivibrio sp. MSJd-27]MBU5450313.1 hypothetical protein [Acetivibrio sp. MSJd-27]